MSTAVGLSLMPDAQKLLDRFSHTSLLWSDRPASHIVGQRPVKIIHRLLLGQELPLARFQSSLTCPIIMRPPLTLPMNMLAWQENWKSSASLYLGYRTTIFTPSQPLP
jgi:hypothetical protein